MTGDEWEEPPEARVFRPLDDDTGEPGPETPTDVKFVGPKTAERLESASIDPLDIPRKEVSYRMLLDAGVDHGTAMQLRREHSLPWTGPTSVGQDLGRRSRQVRGLRDEEAAWVAASAGDWELREPALDAVSTATAEADGGGFAAAREAAEAAAEVAKVAAEVAAADGDGSPTADSDGSSTAGEAEADGGSSVEAAEAAWRDRSRPDPVTTVEDVDEEDEAELARAGITSVQRLATADPERVADVLGVPVERVRGWVAAARETN